MKKKGLSMNLIMALTLTAVAVSVLLCANLVFMQTYRRTLLRNAETTSRQAIAQASSTAAARINSAPMKVMRMISRRASVISS